MALFSKICEYAIRAVLYIAHKTQSGGKVGIKEISSGTDSPEHFLAKILQNLSRKGIILSVKGPNGGFFLDAETLKLPISAIVEVVDGNSLFTGCALGLKQRSAIYPYPLHTNFAEIRNQIQVLMNNTTIGEFNGDLSLGILSLKR